MGTRPPRVPGGYWAVGCFLRHGGPLLVERLGGYPTPTTGQVSGGDRHLNFYGNRDNLYSTALSCYPWLNSKSSTHRHLRCTAAAPRAAGGWAEWRCQSRRSRRATRPTTPTGVRDV